MVFPFFHKGKRSIEKYCNSYIFQQPANVFRLHKFWKTAPAISCFLNKNDLKLVPLLIWEKPYIRKIYSYPLKMVHMLLTSLKFYIGPVFKKLSWFCNSVLDEIISSQRQVTYANAPSIVLPRFTISHLYLGVEKRRKN